MTKTSKFAPEPTSRFARQFGSFEKFSWLAAAQTQAHAGLPRPCARQTQPRRGRNTTLRHLSQLDPKSNACSRGDAVFR